MDGAATNAPKAIVISTFTDSEATNNSISSPSHLTSLTTVSSPSHHDQPPPSKRPRLSSTTTTNSSYYNAHFDPDTSNCSNATTTASSSFTNTEHSASSSSGGLGRQHPSSGDSPRPAAPQPKRRGRPPKSHSTPISPTQLLNMSAEDARYFQMRDKNNEASRRSRLNRKGREQQNTDVADKLEALNRQLVAREQRLETLCRVWKQRVMQLAAAV